jgi:hypothetical protein
MLARINCILLTFAMVGYALFAGITLLHQPAMPSFQGEAARPQVALRVLPYGPAQIGEPTTVLTVTNTGATPLLAYLTIVTAENQTPMAEGLQTEVGTDRLAPIERFLGGPVAEARAVPLGRLAPQETTSVTLTPRDKAWQTTSASLVYRVQAESFITNN